MSVGPRASDGGFVLALVVLMLFAISMASGAGYLVVGNEARMARYAAQGEEALAIARGGLHRFVAEQLGPVEDSARYAIGGGEAVIRARRMTVLDPRTDVYYVRSEGMIADPRMPGSPVRRAVGAYAYHRKQPVPLIAAVLTDAERFRVHGSGSVTGTDVGGSECPGGAAPSITGAIARDAVVAAGPLSGSPPSQVWPGGHTQLLAAMDLRWDVISDPSFPVDYEDHVPDFSTLPADAFPVVRVNGDLGASSAWSGRGVLIVTGQFDADATFFWSGIVLSGWIDDRIDGSIDGMLVGGLSTVDPHTQVESRGDILYHSCNVDRANVSLSYLELVERAVFELD